MEGMNRNEKTMLLDLRLGEQFDSNCVFVVLQLVYTILQYEF